MSSTKKGITSIISILGVVAIFIALPNIYQYSFKWRATMAPNLINPSLINFFLFIFLIFKLRKILELVNLFAQHCAKVQVCDATMYHSSNAAGVKEIATQFYSSCSIILYLSAIIDGLSCTIFIAYSTPSVWVT